MFRGDIMTEEEKKEKRKYMSKARKRKEEQEAREGHRKIIFGDYADEQV